MRLDSLILRAAPSYLLGRKHPGAWAPNLGKFLCVISGIYQRVRVFVEGLAEARTTLCALAPEGGCK